MIVSTQPQEGLEITSSKAEKKNCNTTVDSIAW